MQQSTDLPWDYKITSCKIKLQLVANASKLLSGEKGHKKKVQLTLAKQVQEMVHPHCDTVCEEDSTAVFHMFF